jgi:hypothetical protein
MPIHVMLTRDMQVVIYFEEALGRRSCGVADFGHKAAMLNRASERPGRRDAQSTFASLPHVRAVERLRPRQFKIYG